MKHEVEIFLKDLWPAVKIISYTDNKLEALKAGKAEAVRRGIPAVKIKVYELKEELVLEDHNP